MGTDRRRGIPVPAALLFGLGLAAVVAALALAVTTRSAPESSLTISIASSRFDRQELVVPAGVPVTIELRNTDPIDHEWIVGDDELHRRHRTGTEAYHDARPTEVTIPANSTRTTVVTFASPGMFAFICHLPGHEAHGMTGVVTVVAA